MSKKYKNPPIVEETSVIYKPRKRPTVLRGRPRGDIEQLESKYTFENPMDVKRFLLANKYLIEIIFEAHRQIKRMFGEEITLFLELHCDPEEGWDELFIVIKSPYSAEKAVEFERKLFDEWFIHRIQDTKGKLNFTEEPL